MTDDELAAVAAALRAIERKGEAAGETLSPWKLSDRLPDLTIEEIRAARHP